ncbi:transposase [Streptomyces formicae]|uniref:Transposase n=1 Tax=Streptomyces formicae TaxID=1616117 RepID=A0ABY3WJC3_9ACTN|nr:transposase [Streptomyces formicae]
MLAATRYLNRLEFVIETLRTALNQITEAAGDWLAALAAPEWDRRLLRQHPLHRRLGPASGRLPRRPHERPVARRPEPPRHPGHPRPLRRTALRPLRPADLLHQFRNRPQPDPAAEDRARDSSAGPHRAGHRPLAPPLRTPRWRRGTISQGVQACGLRRPRYRGLAKTRLQHHLTGAAINLARIVAHRQTARPHPRLTLRSTPPHWMRSSEADLPTASNRQGPRRADATCSRPQYLTTKAEDALARTWASPFRFFSKTSLIQAGTRPWAETGRTGFLSFAAHFLPPTRLRPTRRPNGCEQGAKRV